MSAQNIDVQAQAVKALPQIQKGDSGDAVILVQKLLRYLRFSVSVDGSFGDTTKGIVTEFQRRNNLTSDGVVGTSTWHELIRQFNPPSVS
ncbi:peptidoglycan-binding domain-containing protein [Scytonema sp. PCC 10023]|uniref:peptidoglycan-binding domain-containing protein n=1 Tax=Scytonema sp. PCC 10023 TaxID=1680591 RepID=UPI0039C5D20F